jgi:phage terminase large subunit GpA
VSATFARRARAALALAKRRHLARDVVVAHGADAIPEDMSFLDWVEGLARDGLKMDGQLFDLSSRPALRAIYAAVPTTKADGYDQLFTVMKGAQTGATVLTFLLQLYLVLKYEPLKAAAYYPDRGLAAYVSSSRFMPVVRSVPVAHRALLAANGGAEGNVLTRQIGASEVLFLWTSGSSATESFPLGCVVADEVQNMLDDDIERIRERMSASDVRFFFACSTAKWPGADIDLLFQRGDQRRFHTDCACDDGVILDDAFPECIQFNDGRWPEAPRDYVYYQVPLIRTHGAAFEGRRRTRPSGAATSRRFRSPGLGILLPRLRHPHRRPAAGAVGEAQPVQPARQLPLAANPEPHGVPAGDGGELPRRHRPAELLEPEAGPPLDGPVAGADHPGDLRAPGGGGPPGRRGVEDPRLRYRHGCRSDGRIY